VDLILLFHILYYLSPSEQKELIKNMHEHWLTAKGFAVIVSASAGNALGIYERLGKALVAWKDIEADMMEAGFIKQRAYDMQLVEDFSDPDESFLRIVKYVVDRPLTLDELRAAVKEMCPERKKNVYYRLAVFASCH